MFFHLQSNNISDLTSQQFVRVHQSLLNILIGKAGLFSTVPFIGQPLAAVLRQIEGVVDVSFLRASKSSSVAAAQNLANYENRPLRSD
jgi:hypothetical protein